MHLRPIAFVLPLLAALIGAAAAVAEPPSMAPLPSSSTLPPLSADDKALVQKAVDYIDALNAVEGRFAQTDPKGHASTGVFSMQRPGKARFQYDPPAQLLVVSDGETVSVYDRRLKSMDQYPLAQTPLALLLAKPFRLDHGVAILAVDKSKDGFSIVAGDARHRALGRLTLWFAQAPMALKGWTLIDAQGQKTEVRFAALKARPRLDPKLFVAQKAKSRPIPGVTN